MTHPFDRYAAFTDLTALKEASDKPLRKSVRVNTLKMSVEDFLSYAKKKDWHIEPVLWCKEGFFIDRDDRSEALGKDLLHLLGYIYMQEASSMLPVELLDPQPGEYVLDMSAAPGSKTTQIAAKMQGRGVVVANDMQEKRLWTLKTALHRAGAHNVIMTKKVGQWFAKHMTERFDRVLCDAPCTAQGTSRKDSTALQYSSQAAIDKAAKLQKSLLESAVHSAKVGGRIVYSTCTLTPEENEEIVAYILNKFSDQLKPLDIGKIGNRKLGLGESVRDSEIVQQFLSPNPQSPFPSCRLWPQTYDTEGFFAVAFEKTASTMETDYMDWKDFQERPLRRNEMNELSKLLKDLFGTSFLNDSDLLFMRDDQLMLGTKEMLMAHLTVQNYSLGIPFAKGVRDSKHLRLTNELVTARGHMATEGVLALSENELKEILEGKDIECSADLNGDVILRYDDLYIGTGLAKDGMLKNRIPRWIVQQFT